MARLTAGEIVWRITGDSSGLDRSIRKSNKSLKTFGKTANKSNKSLKTFGKTANKSTKDTGKLEEAWKKLGVAVAAIGFTTIIKGWLTAASDAEEVGNKFGVVFSEVAEAANASAANLSESYGLTKTAAKDMLSGTGDVLAGMDMTQEASLDLSTKIVALSADMVSFKNFAGGTAEATQIVTKALLGERDALQSLDLKISQEELDDLAKSQGKLWKNLTQSEKSLLTYDLIVKKSANSIGDFARSADSGANVLRRVNARIGDLSADIGKDLLPALTNLGLNFLRTSKDGGLLTKIFKGLVKGVSKTITGISILITDLERMNKLHGKEAKDQEKRDSGLKAHLKLLKYLNKISQEKYGIDAKHLTVLAKTDAKAANLLKRWDSTAARFTGMSDNTLKYQKSIDDLNASQVENYKVFDDITKKELEGIDEKIDKRKEELNLGDKKGDDKKRGTTPVNYSKEKEAFFAFSSAIHDFELSEEDSVNKEKENNLKKLDEFKKKLGTKNTDLNKKYADLEVSIEQQAADKIDKIKADAAKKEEDRKKKEFTDALNLATNIANSVASYMGNIASGIETLMTGALESQLAGLDAKMQAEFEAQGVADDTTEERYENELEALEEQLGKASSLKEKKEIKENIDTLKSDRITARKKEAIEAEYAEKRKKLEYEIALVKWKFQLASAISTAPLTVLNAVTAGWPLGPIVAGIYGGLAAASAAIQIAAVAASKPSFQTGGIVPGNSIAGDGIDAKLNSGEMILNSSQQKKLFDMTNSGGKGGGNINIHIGDDLIYSNLYQASQNGDLMIDTRAVV